MDFQEKQAFEAEFKKTDFYKMNLVNCFCFITDRYVWDEVQAAWQVWQAAKAKAIPEGFVLVPKEPTPKMIDSTWDDQDEIETMSHNSRNEFIYKKMIEVAMLEAARVGTHE